MAIDYFGMFPCKVRDSLAGGELLAKIKARNQANAALDAMRNHSQARKSEPESEWTVKTIVLTPEGPKERTVRIHALLEQAAPLDALGAHCSGCSMNVRNSAFGCGGAIRYPISTQAERWLVSRLPSDLSSAAGVLLTRAIADFRYDGAVIDAGRRRKEFYEADAPVERKWGGLFRKKTRISSSQILHMAFAVGSLQPVHARLVALFVGYLDAEFAVAEVPSVFPAPEDDPCTIELKYFFRVAALAGTQNVAVFVDA